MRKFKSPKPPKTYEREFATFLKYMIRQATKQFKNNTLLALNKSTVEKFTDDGQSGNYANVFEKLAKEVTEKILKRFSSDRIYKATQLVFNKIDKNNQDRMHKAAANALGVDVKQIIAAENQKETTAALIKSTALWAEKSLSDSLQEYTANTLRLMTLGQDLDSIQPQFNEMAKKRVRNAEMVARTQVSTFNGLVTKIRAQNLGIKEGVWETSHDERVRDSHKARNGKKFELSKGLYSSKDGLTLLPGVDFNCRCTATYILPD